MASSGIGRGRSVLLLISGGIAAYKACLVLRHLQEAGCTVRVAMTESATRFITPLTLEALSGQPVGTTLWGEGGESPLDHIQWAREADLALVVPASMDFLAKLSMGLADDLPTTLLSAFGGPLLVAPAMNDRMLSHPPTLENLRRLATRGVQIIDPDSGWLACGVRAPGRLAEPEEIAAAALARLAPGPLDGQKVVVTAGGTREPIDAVRFLGNHSSGRMGIALAEAARDLGAEVELLLGPTELDPPGGMQTSRFSSVQDLRERLALTAPKADLLAMAAAVSDFRPVAPAAGKIKKSGGMGPIELEPTKDLLKGLGEDPSVKAFLIGFALESGSDAQVEEQAREKLLRKQLDLVVGNRADRAGEGFGGERNRVFLADRGGGNWLPADEKIALAREIWKRALQLRGEAAHG